MRRGLTVLLALSLLLLSGGAFALDGKPGPLVDAGWLAAHHRDAGIVVLDVRDDRRDYVAGHVPGALFTEFADDWRQMVKGVRDMLPPTEKMAKLIGNLGIGNADHVVIVAAGIETKDMAAATRAYWTFKMLGHDAVSILDGGMRAYADIGAETDKRPAKRPPQAFKATQQNHALADTADVARAVAADSVVLVDNRLTARFKGMVRHAEIMRAGTIPNAVNTPATSLFKPRSGFFIGKEALQASFAAVDAAKPAIVFCDNGHWASLTWFALSELLGRRDVRLYDGSLAAWARDPRNPMTLPR